MSSRRWSSDSTTDSAGRTGAAPATAPPPDPASQTPPTAAPWALLQDMQAHRAAAHQLAAHLSAQAQAHRQWATTMHSLGTPPPTFVVSGSSGIPLLSGIQFPVSLSGSAPSSQGSDALLDPGRARGRAEAACR